MSQRKQDPSIQMFKTIIESVNPVQFDEHVKGPILDISVVSGILSDHNLISYFMDIYDQDHSSDGYRKVLSGVIKSWHSKLDALLRNNILTDRYTALLLIRQTVESASYLYLSQYASYIGNLLLEFIKKKNEVDLVKGALVLAIGTFIKRCNLWADVRRDMLQLFFSQYVSYFIKYLKPEKQYINDVLISISWSLEHLATPMKPFTENIKSKCILLMDHSNPTTRELSILCLSLLPFKTDIWNDILDTSLVHMNNLLNFALIGLENDDSDMILEEQNPTPAELLVQFSSKAKSLEYLLSVNYSFNVQFPIEVLFRLILRVFNIDCSNLKSDGSSQFYTEMELINIIPSLHKICYELLNNLLIILKSDMMPYLEILCKVILHGLKLGKQKLCVPLQGTGLRITQYALAQTVIEIFGISVSDLLCKTLVPYLLEDLVPSENTQQEVVVPQNRKRKKDALKNKLQLDINSSIETQHSSHNNTSYNLYLLKKCALNVLGTILLELSSLLNRKIREKIDKTIIALCIKMINSKQASPNSDYEGVFLYPPFRKHLFNLLKESVESSISTQPPILPYAVKFFRFGMNDEDRKVSKLCKSGLAVASLLTHPKVPPIVPRDAVRKESEFASSLHSVMVQNSDEIEPVVETPIKKRKIEKFVLDEEPKPEKKSMFNLESTPLSSKESTVSVSTFGFNFSNLSMNSKQETKQESKMEVDGEEDGQTSFSFIATGPDSDSSDDSSSSS
eukprot:TRINITY_DN6367_c0_g1_i1.p1 TRINITY_DN6367_c0_g1~~TRINITY_DN6367_c0_g1_i1.p1  ORF type:complete len:736 (+),score=130.10 TRINITY_DN6367_c0_g1_i1:99-2306(+)